MLWAQLPWPVVCHALAPFWTTESALALSCTSRWWHEALRDERLWAAIAGPSRSDRVPPRPGAVARLHIEARAWALLYQQSGYARPCTHITIDAMWLESNTLRFSPPGRSYGVPCVWCVDPHCSPSRQWCTAALWAQILARASAAQNYFVRDRWRLPSTILVAYRFWRAMYVGALTCLLALWAVAASVLVAGTLQANARDGLAGGAALGPWWLLTLPAWLAALLFGLVSSLLACGRSIECPLDCGRTQAGLGVNVFEPVVAARAVVAATGLALWALTADLGWSPWWLAAYLLACGLALVGWGIWLIRERSGDDEDEPVHDLRRLTVGTTLGLLALRAGGLAVPWAVVFVFIWLWLAIWVGTELGLAARLRVAEDAYDRASPRQWWFHAVANDLDLVLLRPLKHARSRRIVCACALLWWPLLTVQLLAPVPAINWWWLALPLLVALGAACYLSPDLARSTADWDRGWIQSSILSHADDAPGYARQAWPLGPVSKKVTNELAWQMA